MTSRSSIEWTSYTWNPLTGCNKISPGCKNCYAALMSKRLKAMGVAKYANEFQLTLHESLLYEPLSWNTPRVVFVNSMSDMFHEDVPEEFILKVFGVMKQAHQHTFQVLTKRSEHLLALNHKIDWPENVWMGVSVENQNYMHRIEHLKKTGAYIKFLSLEPLLGPLPHLNVKGIDWVIAGGESGPRSRPVCEEWITDIRDRCLFDGVPFFFKQWGGTRKKKTGRVLQGRTWDELPISFAGTFIG